MHTKPIVPPPPRHCPCEVCQLRNKVEHLQAALSNITQFSTDDEAVKVARIALDQEVQE